MEREKQAARCKYKPLLYLCAMFDDKEKADDLSHLLKGGNLVILQFRRRGYR